MAMQVPTPMQELEQEARRENAFLYTFKHKNYERVDIAVMDVVKALRPYVRERVHKTYHSVVLQQPVDAAAAAKAAKRQGQSKAAKAELLKRPEYIKVLADLPPCHVHTRHSGDCSPTKLAKLRKCPRCGPWMKVLAKLHDKQGNTTVKDQPQWKVGIQRVVNSLLSCSAVEPTVVATRLATCTLAVGVTSSEGLGVLPWPSFLCRCRHRRMKPRQMPPAL